MSSHVGTITIGGFPPEKEVIAEELGGQPRQALQILTFSFEQGKTLVLADPILPVEFIIL
jgi:hypothetical protein